MTKSEWILGLAVVAGLAVLPFLAHWARRDTRPTCDYDGIVIYPAYAGRVIDADGVDHAFCCIVFAQPWMERGGRRGCGPVVDLSRCAFRVAPRRCAYCPLNHGPIPGGVSFCPQHACSILYCPPLSSQAGAPGAE